MKGLGFYEAAAQIIPILVLVLIIELRFLDQPRDRITRVVAPLFLTLIAVGEWRALNVLLTEQAAKWETTLVWSALGAETGLFAGVTFAIAQHARAGKSAGGQEQSAPPDEGPP